MSLYFVTRTLLCPLPYETIHFLMRRVLVQETTAKRIFRWLRIASKSQNNQMKLTE